MEGQKTENLLNLALDATQEEREKSLELEVGYHPEEREWDLIIKYSGDLEGVRGIAARTTELLNEYAVVTVAESRIQELAALPEVEYVEKPKRLYFQMEEGKRVSCINEVQDARFSLLGQGVLVGVIDSGIDYSLPEFRRADGTTRIKSLWDQSLDTAGEEPPGGYGYGREYGAERINEALQAGSEEERLKIVPSLDRSGHGTAVAGIAAGIAPESELLVVKLGNPLPDGFPRTTELMTGIDYVIRKAVEYQMPVAVNISFGNTYGPHDGTSLLERFIDDISNIWKNCICVGAGNEAAGAGHTAGRVREDQEEVIELAVQERQPALNIQIWKAYTDVMDITLIDPSGLRAGPDPGGSGVSEISGGRYGDPAVLRGAESLQYGPGDLYRPASGRRLYPRGRVADRTVPQESLVRPV